MRSIGYSSLYRMLGWVEVVRNDWLSSHRFQVCLVMIVINMAVRCDITSVVYAIWLGTFLVLGRQNCSIVWPVYVGFLAVLLPLQYLLVLGWPPALCLGMKHRSFDQSFNFIDGLLVSVCSAVLCLCNTCFVFLLVTLQLLSKHLPGGLYPFFKSLFGFMFIQSCSVRTAIKHNEPGNGLTH